ncbi:uncharacterized protein J4E78_003992 [Alternaria triticimaculans]|uniref:uncharacterized protein n=1 Tax=Alternaria triticimaculans TaxID=297637 RepID=UPI0020C590B2|nr:uncharacterized protein J4E78_003992 [Alternaria triticimaculans]KAI4663576.1 hypothetical protein J4E78_003992 [Alternaria triticimaculans]
MRVIEKDTDRKAQVNIFVKGQVQALEEYGEYVDPRDKAICCYVPIDEGHQPKVGGRFSGKTLAVAYDTFVDGILRKAGSHVAKSVILHNRKLDTETFLCKTSKGIIDTDITVTPLEHAVTIQNDAPETTGTIELRLYITRQLGDWHEIGKVKKYYAHESDMKDRDTGGIEQKVGYNRIAPIFRMSFEKDTTPLEDNQSKIYQRRADAKRPGTEPWAIFRFHYRTEAEILEENMSMSFDPDDKDIGEAHTLMLEPLPPLTIGAKPLSKNDGDASSRSESPMLPNTPAKSAQPIPKISSPIKKPGPPPNPSEATTMSSPKDKAQTATPEAPSVPTADMTAKVPCLPESSTKPANAHAEKSVAVAKATTKKPINTTNGQKKSDTPPVAVIPVKRSSTTTSGITPPEPKRTMLTPTPTLPIAQPVVPRSSTPKTLSIERQLADQRKKLEDMRKMRMETAKKQAEIDEQMGPYKQRMAEELDRLNQELIEMESAYTEEAEHYNASVEVLQEFKKADGDNE